MFPQSGRQHNSRQVFFATTYLKENLIPNFSPWRGHNGILCGCGMLNVNYVTTCKYVSQRSNYCRNRFDTTLAQLLFTPCLQIISQQLKAQGSAPQGHHCLCQMFYRKKAENIQLLSKSIYRWELSG